MAKFPEIRPFIDAALALDLGNPNYTISTKEQLIKESAITLGTLDYYRVFPLRVIYMTAYNSTGGMTQTSVDWTGVHQPKYDNGSMYIPFDDFLTGGRPRIPDEQMEHAHFLGIIRMERPYWGNWSNPSVWDSQFFGFPLGTSTTFDITQILLNNSYDELSTGQPKCWINRTENRLEILSPWGLGCLELEAAIGFDSPEYITMNHVDWLCKFISKRFLEGIIQAREGVKFQGDFEISTDFLQKRLEKLDAEVDSIRNHSVISSVGTQWS